MSCSRHRRADISILLADRRRNICHLADLFRRPEATRPSATRPA
jgi:hypothetical protein